MRETSNSTGEWWCRFRHTEAASKNAPLNEGVSGVDRSKQGSKAAVFDDIEQLVAAIVVAAQPGDHVVVMSNGGFGGIHAKLLNALQLRASRKSAL